MPQDISRLGGTTVSGARSTFSPNQDRREQDYLPEIALLQPNQYPLVAFSSQLGSTPVINRNFKWLEDNLFSEMTTANGAVADTGGTITLTDANKFAANDLLLIPRTGDMAWVSSVTNSTQAAVTRFPGASDIQDGDEIIAIRGGAWAEYSASPTALTTQTVTRQNYTQIMKTSVQFSKSQELQKWRGGSDMAYQIRKKAIEHAIAIEWLMWFGKASSDISGDGGSSTVYCMSGVREQLNTSANVRRLDGIDLSSLDGNLLDAFCEELFRYNMTDTNTKVLFCAPAIATRVSQIAKDTTPGGGSGGLQMRPDDTIFGIKIVSYRSPHGDLQIVPHWLFKDSTVFNRVGYALDMAAIRMRHLRETEYQDNIQDNDIDGTKAQYLSDLSLMVQLPECHGIIELRSLD